ncbi:MAG: hypothetical protein RL597_55, partial [Pseudomonadota bacterium]
MSTLCIAIEFSGGEIEAGYELTDERRLADARLADEHTGFVAQNFFEPVELIAGLSAAMQHR